MGKDFAQEDTDESYTGKTIIKPLTSLGWQTAEGYEGKNSLFVTSTTFFRSGPTLPLNRSKALETGKVIREHRWTHLVFSDTSFSSFCHSFWNAQYICHPNYSRPSSSSSPFSFFFFFCCCCYCCSSSSPSAASSSLFFSLSFFFFVFVVVVLFFFFF